jgi:hypothetical protein
MGGRRRHHRPGGRSQRKAGDHEDREQLSYGEAWFHQSKFSQMGGHGKLIISHNMSSGGRCRSVSNCQTWLKPRLPIGSTDHGHEFGYLFSLISFVAAGDRVLDAMRDVISEHFFLDAPERGPDR